MWIELKPTDDINVLNDFANIRSEFGCSRVFDGRTIKFNMINKSECTYWRSDESKHTALIGFKYNLGTKKMMWMTFLIINCIELDYPLALAEMAQKTKDILEKHQLPLINEYDYRELEEINQTFGIGYYTCFNMFKTECEKLGMVCNFDDNHIEISL